MSFKGISLCQDTLSVDDSAKYFEEPMILFNPKCSPPKKLGSKSYPFFKWHGLHSQWEASSHPKLIKPASMLRLAVQSRRLAIRKGNLYPHLFHTFSDFAFLALCTNLRPSFLAYQIEANIVMPLEGIHNEAAAQTTSHLGSETNGIRLELSLAGCCFLSSSHAG